MTRVAAEKGETKWTLAVAGEQKPTAVPRKFVGVSLGQLDRMEDGAETGRRRFGAPPPKDNRNDEDSSSSDEEENQPTDVDGLIAKGQADAIRRQKREDRREKKAREAELAARRRSREINLNSPRGGGISSGGGGSSRPTGRKRKSTG